jgi:hypothetical protein
LNEKSRGSSEPRLAGVLLGEGARRAAHLLHDDLAGAELEGGLDRVA